MPSVLSRNQIKGLNKCSREDWNSAIREIGPAPRLIDAMLQLAWLFYWDDVF